MSRPRRELGHHLAGFPRVSGDEPAGKQAVTTLATFSPRERG